MSDALRLDKRKARVAARGAADARRWQRVEIPLKARFLAPDGTEHSATLEDISPGGARFTAAWLLEKGARVVVNVEGLGRLEGVVARETPDGFAVRLSAGPRKRERLADELTWRLNRERMEIGDDRSAPRLPRRGRARIGLEGGQEILAELIDVSTTGMAFQSETRPPVDAKVSLGRLSGVVARHLPDGFAIKLDPPEARTRDAGPEAA
ncbi:MULTISPECIES: PilZ domain-containing protein [Euryhalocaulis]|uniref:PilZ domain-containing protein n=1 Tax=Euryhalocaulis TaxID=1712422 RepID=UPI0003A10B2D|nr:MULTISPECIES: PilZ domain-containing protein [Euryhalocaulis]MBA4802042.1 PilZ domain-containing protein [Euryhalocaulis sp.]